MNPTDTLSLSQHFLGLDKPVLQQTATALATQNAQQASQLSQVGQWIKDNVPKHIGRGPRLGITVATGAMVGIAYGALPHPWALVATASVAAASGMAAAMAKTPDWIDAALAVTAGAAASALAVEAAKGTSEFMAKRAMAKGTAVASTAPAPTNANANAKKG